MGSAPGPAPKMHPAPGQVVEQHDAVGHQPRVVVRERHHAGAELDVLGALGGGGDEDLGAADQLVAAGVVLAEPRLVVAEAVELDDALEVVLEGERRALPDGVERREEHAEAQGPGAGMSVDSPRCDVGRGTSSRAALTSSGFSCCTQWPAPSTRTVPRWSVEPAVHRPPAGVIEEHGVVRCRR